jgi:hypothetical protein
MIADRESDSHHPAGQHPFPRPAGRSRHRFDQGVQPIDGQVLKHLRFAAMPMNFQSVDLGMFTQTEMKPCAVMALIASTAVNFSHLRELAAGDYDPGADRIPIGSGTDQT